MSYGKFCSTLFLVLFQVALYSQEITLARYPAISNDGQTIAFSYQGDIWIKDLQDRFPRRLTIHEAYESDPIFSPDGSQLTFTGARFGNKDVFVIGRDGGVPERLTYHSTNDEVTDWTADNQLLFGTRRAYASVERDDEIYSVPLTGGTPSRFLDVLGEMAVMSPNSRYIAFVRGVCRTSRESYNGPADLDIWLYDTRRESYTAVTSNSTNDFLPRWGSNDELYFLSSINGRYNIVKVDADDESFRREVITTYEDQGVRHFDVADETIVLERGQHLYLKRGEAQPEEINLQISADYRFDPVETKSYNGNIKDYTLSPNAKTAAMVIRGEVFVHEMDRKKKRTVNISSHPFRDRSPSWLNDSALIFTSDRSGQYDLYLARSTDPEKPLLFNSLKRELVRITNTIENEEDPTVSPDGEQIAFRRGRGQLIVADISPEGSLSNERILLDGWATPSDISWSPDGRYLAYSLSDLNFNREIYILAADSAMDPVNVSMHPRGDYSPHWSPDGSKLAFLSSRNDGDMDVWFVWLTEEDWLKTREDREEGYYFSDPDPGPEVVADTTEPERSPSVRKGHEDEDVKIDFDRIYDRLKQVTSLPGDEHNVLISHDGETFYFTAKNDLGSGSDLFQARYDGNEIKQLTSGGANPSRPKLHPEAKVLYYLRSGKIQGIKIENQKTTTFPHEAVMTINRQLEREQMFDEAWSALNESFYDPQFHGRDWQALRNRYRPLAIAASTSQDFRDMFNLMLGEVDASHMGLYGPNPEEVQRERTGLLGVEVEPAEEGGVVVKHVVENTPADRPNSRLREGDRIITVDGEEITPATNFHHLLAHKDGRQVLLMLRNEDGRERELVIRPTRSINQQLYDEWVRERQRLTEEYSDGRLGYIHIRGMNKPSFESFERDLMASGGDKDGIVIDVRYNGGGWTTDYLMAVLTVRQHAYTIPRGAAGNLQQEHQKFSDYYPYSERLPLSAWVKPSVALCNESSYSNAEIFSHAYKNLDIGTLVGKPTFGAVISTGSTSLLDGSRVRMPFRGWYVKATGENMENGPAVPDMVVDNEPEEKSEGTDSQLKAAVEVLLMEVNSRRD